MDSDDWQIVDGHLCVWMVPDNDAPHWALAGSKEAALALRAAVEAEREACARIADNSKGPTNLTRNRCCDTIATAIRARGEG